MMVRIFRYRVLLIRYFFVIPLWTYTVYDFHSMVRIFIDFGLLVVDG